MTQTPAKKYNILFAGTPEFAVPVLEALHDSPQYTLVGVLTQPDKPVGRHHTLTPSPVKEKASSWDIPVHQPSTLKNAAATTLLTDLTPDVVVVVAYGKIIPKSLLTIPPHGWVNVHASLLPRHRGASPIQAAILAGDTETGVTLMQLDAGLDTGAIIAQKQIPLTGTETSELLHDTLSQLGAEIVMESLHEYLAGTLKPQPQATTGVTTTGIIQKADGHIDWHRPARDIDRLVRAYTPWPGAYTQWDGRRLLIRRAHVPKELFRLMPGTVKNTGTALLVGTGAGVLQIDTVQLEGKAQQNAADFLRGHPAVLTAQLS